MKFRVVKTPGGRFYIQLRCWGLWWTDVLRADECDSRMEFTSLDDAVAWIARQNTTDEVVWPTPDWRASA